jgi:uncharacterized protein involved in type VI secretion and phage assembly
VRVQFPTLDDQESNWARLVTPMAGKERGLFLRPEVGDEVLCAFELGDPRRPYILGSLWSKVDPPPPDDGDAGQNNWRFIRSRSGHIVRLDDTAGAEKIEIIGKDEQRRVVIDVAGQKIQIVCDSGDVEVSAPAGTVKVDGLTVEVKAAGNMSLEATGALTIKGATVSIN